MYPKDPSRFLLRWSSLQHCSYQHILNRWYRWKPRARSGRRSHPYHTQRLEYIHIQISIFINIRNIFINMKEKLSESGSLSLNLKTEKRLIIEKKEKRCQVTVLSN